MFGNQAHAIIFALILVLAFVLRLFHLADESIWLDEGISIAMSKLSLSEMIDKSAVDSLPPLYYSLLHYWMLLFGDSEFSVRFLSLIFSLSTIVAAYQVTKLLIDETVALVVAFLLAISVFHIEYAQEARMYSLIALLSTLSWYFFLQWREESKIRWIVLLFVINVLLLYTHVLAAFFLLTQNMYWWFSKEKGSIATKSWLLMQFFLLCSFAPWMTVLFGQASTWHSTVWMPLPSVKEILGTVSTYSGSVALALLFCALILKGLISFKEEKRRVVFLLIWLALPTFLLLLFCFVFKSIYLQKYTIASSVPFFILVAYGLKSVVEKKHKIAVLLSVSVLCAIKLAVYYVEDRKEQWREAVALIEKKATQEDVILFDAAYCRHNAFNYYAKRADLNKLPLLDVHEEWNEHNVSNLDSLSMGSKSTWLVLSHSRDKHGLLKKEIGEYKVLFHQNYIGIELFQLERKVGQ